MRGLLLAIATLTRLPVRVTWTTQAAARSGAWFPLVGALTGLIVAGALWLAGPVLSLVPVAAVVVAIAVELVLTGALHLDGLADSADGLGGRDRDHRLAIMKDHSVGVYGVAAVVLALLVRLTCLSAVGLSAPSVLSTMTWAPGVAGVVLVWTLSRAAMLLPAVALPYAREDGTGQAVIDGLRPATALAGASFALGVAVLAVAAGVPLSKVLAAVAAALIAALAVTALARRLLAGATGDVLGATAEVSLAAALLALTSV